METSTPWFAGCWPIILTVGAIIGTKFILNLRALLQTLKYLKRYEHYLTTETHDFHGDIPSVKDLLRKAGLSDTYISRLEPAGYGYARTMKAPVLDNIHMRDDEVVPRILLYFAQAKGVFRRRMLDAINPFYWLETIIFLPRTTLGYLGVTGESLIVKILQVVYWTASAAVAVIKYLELVR